MATNQLIYTIGHSSHSKEDFLQMLQHLSIKVLIDVRAFPGSRKYPAFSRDAMPDWLDAAGIVYHHLPELGGRRRESEDVGVRLNAGWRNQSFHRYADYTLSGTFQRGIQMLSSYGARSRTAYFCAERHPARCHRLLISNWLAANGWTVKHIIDQNDGKIEVIEHELGRWGATPIIEGDGTVVYPG